MGRYVARFPKTVSVKKITTEIASKRQLLVILKGNKDGKIDMFNERSILITTF
jgi:hypothetical protein